MVAVLTCQAFFAAGDHHSERLCPSTGRERRASSSSWPLTGVFSPVSRAFPKSTFLLGQMGKKGEAVASLFQRLLPLSRLPFILYDSLIEPFQVVIEAARRSGRLFYGTYKPPAFDILNDLCRWSRAPACPSFSSSRMPYRMTSFASPSPPQAFELGRNTQEVRGRSRQRADGDGRQRSGQAAGDHCSINKQAAHFVKMLDLVPDSPKYNTILNYKYI